MDKFTKHINFRIYPTIFAIYVKLVLHSSHKCGRDQENVDRDSNAIIDVAGHHCRPSRVNFEP